jgi:L-ascorbate metabolism protein UlaG (beta-lactamase superfamily)
MRSLPLAFALSACCAFSAPAYRGRVTDHFDGTTFENQVPFEHGTIGNVLEFLTTREPGPWPEWVSAPPGKAPPERVLFGEVRVTFVGHATMLLQVDGVNVLTDPIWSSRSSPVGFAGSHRVRAPGLRFADLPPIDAVIISHNHYDHLDLPTLRRLRDAHAPAFVVPLGNKKLLAANGIHRTVELDWWEMTQVGRLRVHAVPAQHFSARGICDRNKVLWAGYVLDGSGGPVYFAGDTGWGPHFAQVRKKFGRPRLAVLPIGAYLPRWFMKPIHIDPAEAAKAHQVLGAHTSVGMHFDTFALADEAAGQAPKDLRKAAATLGISKDRFWVLGFGEGRVVP